MLQNGSILFNCMIFAQCHYSWSSYNPSWLDVQPWSSILISCINHVSIPWYISCPLSDSMLFWLLIKQDSTVGSSKGLDLQTKSSALDALMPALIYLGPLLKRVVKSILLFLCLVLLHNIPAVLFVIKTPQAFIPAVALWTDNCLCVGDN